MARQPLPVGIINPATEPEATLHGFCGCHTGASIKGQLLIEQLCHQAPGACRRGLV
jgi:hypothetical protein